MVALTLRTVESTLTNFINFAKTYHGHSFTGVTEGLHEAIEVQENSTEKKPKQSGTLQLICHQNNPNQMRIFRIYMLESRKNIHYIVKDFVIFSSRPLFLLNLIYHTPFKKTQTPPFQTTSYHSTY